MLQLFMKLIKDWWMKKKIKDDGNSNHSAKETVHWEAIFVLLIYVEDEKFEFLSTVALTKNVLFHMKKYKQFIKKIVSSQNFCEFYIIYNFCMSMRFVCMMYNLSLHILLICSLINAINTDLWLKSRERIILLVEVSQSLVSQL